MAHVWRSEVNLWALALSLLVPSLNSGHLAWRQVPLPAESPQWPCIYYLENSGSMYLASESYLTPQTPEEKPTSLGALPPDSVIPLEEESQQELCGIK